MTKPRIATISMAGCFGCHMSLLDLDERIVELASLVDFDRSPLTSIKQLSTRCRIGYLEGGCATDLQVEELRRFREQCDILISIGDCAVDGDVPSLRNSIPLGECLAASFLQARSVHNPRELIPNDPELPLLLDRVYPCHEVVEVDHFLPGCPPRPEAIWQTLTDLLADKPITLPYPLLKYD